MVHLSAYSLLFLLNPDVCVGGPDVDLTDFRESETLLISSPGWPGKYANNAECIWNVVVQTGFVVIVQIYDFQLEYPNDYLQIGKKRQM